MLHFFNPSSSCFIELFPTGQILSSRRIDREQLAPSGGSGWINVTLVAYDTGFPSSRATSIGVKFRVNDINDNHPVFHRNSYDVRNH